MNIDSKWLLKRLTTALEGTYDTPHSFILSIFNSLIYYIDEDDPDREKIVQEVNEVLIKLKQTFDGLYRRN